MLYLVGGASRSGKTRLARSLLERKGIAYFPVDALMMGFFNGYPDFGLDPETSGIVRGEKLWPILRAVVVNLIEEKLYHPDYLFEGDELLPKHAAELAGAYPGEVRACFLGYTDVVPAEKLRAVRQFEPEWAKFYNDDGIVLAFLERQAEFSRYLQQECATHGLPYFDVSNDFDGGVEAAYKFLVTGKHER
jgi:hypothetical protein